MTYGQVKFRLTKAFPGIDSDLIEGAVADSYSEILSELPWRRLQMSAVLQTTAPYQTGTVTMTSGSTGVTGSGTFFNSLQSGLTFRVAGRPEFYEFAYATSTSGLLDRPYEGTTGPGQSYSITQQIYPLPPDCRMLEDDAFANFTLGELRRISHGQLNISDPSRSATGIPMYWSDYMDDSSDPPRMQVELYPPPDSVMAIPFVYFAEKPTLVGAATSLTLLPWILPSALIELASAKIVRHMAKANLSLLPLAESHVAAHNNAMRNMRVWESQGMQPTQMRVGDYYTSYRSERWSR